MTLLTKSKYLLGQQCLRLLWHSNKKLIPKPSMADQHRFNQGSDFEKYVKLLFDQGIELGNLDYQDNLKKTEELVQNKKTIFEAGFQLDELFCRADILEPIENGWNLYEIKSTSQAKPHHYIDLAFQKYVLEKAGLNIINCYVLHLNKEYVKQGEINPKELVSKTDVTKKVNSIDDIAENSKLYLRVIKQEETPDINISKNCNKPYSCSLKKDCWGTLADSNVTHLTDWRTYWKLFQNGIIDMKDIPADIKLKPKDQRIKKAGTEQKIIVIKDEIKKFFDKLQFPLYHFDFETFDTAVPIYDQSKPYQKIPFQYSLHIQHQEGKLEHFEYLSDGMEDPRIKLLEQLKDEIKGEGSVVVFNQSFEKGVLTKLAEDFPENKEWIDNVLGRIVDLAEPFQNFYYYCPSQKGSYSIKKVMPAITGKGYDDLDISNGADASALYFQSHISGDSEHKEVIRVNLIKYCGLDTEGMIWIVDELKKLV